ncbi:MAG: hypothetical protein FIA95_05635, partial [Gemmatimonadetes bacterium]|nr:hypothetical protein [Gemmatimonadota bacterium]
MSDGESRSLGWVALLLLAASVVRFVWGSPEDSPPAAGPDVLPGLLAESRNQAAEAQRRSAPLGAEERLDPNRAAAAELD